MEFVGFPKIARYSRECIITEKIDGTNAQIYIIPDDELNLHASMSTIERVAYDPDLHLSIFAGSKTRYITPSNDNHGFARWVQENSPELFGLGRGRHYGEWWGQGIQRNYGLKEKRWSLFNTVRWVPFGMKPGLISINEKGEEKWQDVLPACCNLVPVIEEGMFGELNIPNILDDLKMYGSRAVPSFMKLEGIVIYHTAGNVAFKKTIEKDDEPKSKNAG